MGHKVNPLGYRLGIIILIFLDNVILFYLVIYIYIYYILLLFYFLIY